MLWGVRGVGGGAKFIFQRVYHITRTTSANANRKTSMSRLEAMVYGWGLVVKEGGISYGTLCKCFVA